MAVAPDAPPLQLEENPELNILLNLMVNSIRDNLTDGRRQFNQFERIIRSR